MEHLQNDELDLNPDLNIDFNVETDSGFDVGDGVIFDEEDEFDDSLTTDNFDTESDADINPEESVISGKVKLNANDAISIRSYIEMALTTDKSIKLTPEELSLVVNSEFKDAQTIRVSQSLKDQLVNDPKALEETIKYYKGFKNDILNERIKCLNSHIKAVSQACDKTKRGYYEDIEECKCHLSTITSTINNINQGGKSAEQSLHTLKERYKILEKSYLTKKRDYFLMSLKQEAILTFLKGYKEVYEKVQKAEIQEDTSKYGLLLDLDLATEGKHTARCSCCNHTFPITNEQLPSLEVGKMTYDLDFLNGLKDLYEKVLEQSKITDEKYTKEAYSYVKQTAEALGYHSEVAKAESLPFYSDRVQHLNADVIVNHMRTTNPAVYARYYNVLFAKTKEDLRIYFEKFMTSVFVIGARPIQDPEVKKLFPNLVTPTYLNVFRNRNPLLMKKVEDDINKLSQQPNIPSVAYEYRVPSAATQYIMSKLDDNFLYPNPSMEYLGLQGEGTQEELLKQHRNQNLLGRVRLDKTSPLRLKLPDIECPECQAKLLYYHPVLTAMRIHLVSFMSKGTIVDDLDTNVTVNLKPLLAPITKSTLKSKTDIFEKLEAKKASVRNPVKEMMNKQRTINTSNKGTTLENSSLNKTQIDESTGMIQHIKHEYGFVYDTLATRFYRAQLDGNILEMENIINENHKILSERNDATSKNLITEQVQRLAMKVAEAVKTKDNALLDKLIKENDKLIESAKTLEQPFAKALVEIVESRSQEQDEEVKQDKTPQDYLEEYGDVDLNTLSYEELTSKGLYKYENALKAYNVSNKEFECIEAILVKVLDDDGMQKLPDVLKESIAEIYDIVDGVPDSMISDGMAF